MAFSSFIEGALIGAVVAGLIGLITLKSHGWLVWAGAIFVVLLSSCSGVPLLTIAGIGALAGLATQFVLDNMIFKKPQSGEDQSATKAE